MHFFSHKSFYFTANQCAFTSFLKQVQRKWTGLFKTRVRRLYRRAGRRIQNKAQLDAEIKIFQNALEFTTVKAREVMVPRAEVTAIENGKSIEELRDLFASTGYSKIPVYENSVDDIIGFVHAFEMLKKPKTIKEILLPVECIHEPNPINEVLVRLTRKRKSFAVVLDEYGGTQVFDN